MATTLKTNNFMYYDYEDILPRAEWDFDYTLDDSAWDLIEAAGEDDPSLTVTEDALLAMQKIDYIKAGLTYEFDYSEWFDDVYPNFND